MAINKEKYHQILLEQQDPYFDVMGKIEQVTDCNIRCHLRANLPRPEYLINDIVVILTFREYECEGLIAETLHQKISSLYGDWHLTNFLFKNLDKYNRTTRISFYLTLKDEVTDSQQVTLKRVATKGATL